MKAFAVPRKRRRTSRLNRVKGHRELLRLVPADASPDHELLAAPGGFLWWYLDVVDADGNGVVLIWSFGLPFLPGYQQAARVGTPERPIDRPSLNLAVYRRGIEAFYLLKEYEREQVTWERDHWRFGDTCIARRREDGRCQVDVDLRLPVPGDVKELHGTLRLDGRSPRLASVTSQATPSARDPQHWSVIAAPAAGRVSLRYGDSAFCSLQGRGYHDRNSSVVPLDRLGIRRWLWGRLSTADGEWIAYVLWPSTNDRAPEAQLLEIGPDGSTVQHGHIGVHLGGKRSGRYAVPWWETVSLVLPDGRSVQFSPTHRLEDGPFYLRFGTSAEVRRGASCLARGTGALEVCEPQRVDRGSTRPLVRMRVHGGPCADSVWLPLFSGPRKGRALRTVRQMVASLAGM